jgi:hypothetical protein
MRSSSRSEEREDEREKAQEEKCGLWLFYSLIG